MSCASYGNTLQAIRTTFEGQGLWIAVVHAIGLLKLDLFMNLLNYIVLLYALLFCPYTIFHGFLLSSHHIDSACVHDAHSNFM